jgi:cold shock CspA family protein
MTKKRFEPPAPRGRSRGVAKGGRPAESGQRIRGRILQLVRGQGHGFIRTDDGRKLFFHRSDVMNNSFNDLTIGDSVTGEVIPDRISGSRAVKARKT